jgi:hypothetical protein
MKVLIIPTKIAEKLRQTKFPEGNELNPVKGVLNGVEMEWLQAELKDNKIFAEVLKDFEACELKDINTIEQKFYDEKDTEITPVKETIQISEMVATQVLEKGVLVTKEVERIIPVEVEKYYDSKMIEQDVFSLTCKTVLTDQIIK